MSVKVNSAAVDRAAGAWGEAPDWVRTLATACDATSQRRVAERLGYSPSVVNRVLGGSYPGDLAEVESRVRAKLGAEDVVCPAIGDEIPLTACRRHRAAVNADAPARNHHQQLFRRHCPSCLHNPLGERP